MYIPSFTQNIISLAKIVDGTGYTWNGLQNIITMLKRNQVVAKAKGEQRFFWIHSQAIKWHAVFNTEESSDHDKDIGVAYVALGHASPSKIETYLNKTQTQNVLQAKLKKLWKIAFVVKSMFLKHTVLSSRQTENTQLVIGHIAMIEHPTMLFQKSWTQKIKLQMLQFQWKAFQNLLQISNLSPCFIRADNEFRTRKLREFCLNNGIILENTAPYSLHQNGTAEAMNKII